MARRKITEGDQNCVGAIVHYDDRGCIYRVEAFEDVSGGNGKKHRFVHDYVCDNEGNVLEKRALEESGGAGNITGLMDARGDMAARYLASAFGRTVAGALGTGFISPSETSRPPW